MRLRLLLPLLCIPTMAVPPPQPGITVKILGSQAYYAQYSITFILLSISLLYGIESLGYSGNQSGL